MFFFGDLVLDSNGLMDRGFAFEINPSFELKFVGVLLISMFQEFKGEMFEKKLSFWSIQGLMPSTPH